MNQTVECLCKGNKNCFFCLGTGVVHKSDQRKMILKSFDQHLITSVKLEVQYLDFCNEPDLILPNKVAYVITENTITKNPTQKIWFDHFHRNQTVGVTLPNSINSLIKKTFSQSIKGVRKNKCFKIDFLINNVVVPFNEKKYSSSKYSELFNDIMDYFFSAYKYQKIKEFLDSL